MPGALRVVFLPERVSLDTVQDVVPRATLRLEGLGQRPSVLPEAQPQPCSLRFFVTYLNRLRDGSAGDTKQFASLSGQVERVQESFFFTTDPEATIVHDAPDVPPPSDQDPRLSRPLIYELSFDPEQCDTLEDQQLEVPRAPDDAARFVELRATLEINGATEGSLESSGVWDVPYAPLRREITVGVFEPRTTGRAQLLVRKSDGTTALNDAGESNESSRDFDLTELPTDDLYEIEMALGTIRLAPPFSLDIKELELGLLFEDAQRAAQALTLTDTPVPAPLSGSENHNFGNIPFDESPTREFVEVTFVDDADVPLAGRPFRATFADGTTQDGVLDAAGHARLGAAPRGDVQVELLDAPDALLNLEAEATT